MSTTDKTLKFTFIWIAIMLTIIAAVRYYKFRFSFAQEDSIQSSNIVLKEPIEVIIKQPTEIDIADWNAYPRQAIKVKIDDQ